MARRKRRVLILDTYYPAFLARLRFQANDYACMLAEALATGFGTSDFVSRGFRNAGWEAVDVIANCDALAKRWQTGHCETPGVGIDFWLSPSEVVLEQVRAFRPDVLFLQDVSFLTAEEMRIIKAHGILIAAQISCAMPNEANVRECDTIFTSFPHFVPRFQALGVNGVFSRLCFEPELLARIGPQVRDLDVAFVGGVCGSSATGCWAPGTALLEAVAREISTFAWWGYGVETLKAGSPLAGCYMGEAWGLDQYRIYARAKVAINRHSIHSFGADGKSCGNNMRNHEAVGMGACLLTDASDSYADGAECMLYRDAAEAVRLTRELLDGPDRRMVIAEAGQRACLAEETYSLRYRQIVATLEERLCRLGR